MASPAEPNSIGPPKIALKLSPAGQKQKQADKDFIAKSIRKIEPNLGLIPVVGPLVPAGSLAAIAQKVALGVALDPKYQGTDFDAWYEVTFESQTSITAASNVDPTEYAIPSWVLKLVQDLHNVDEVESVHPMQAGPPPTVNAGDDPRNTNQGYLDAAPKGINARYAWGFPGGDGAGANVVDMEQGWNLNHEDLSGANITLISGVNKLFFYHGTGVLGEILMVDNQKGGVGIATKGNGRVVSEWRSVTDTTRNIPAAILDAITHMSFGDVLLLESQEYDPVGGRYKWPVEIVDANYDAIRLATALGITVIEAGCNGSFDLDPYVNLAGKKIFDRSSRDFRDSGAIMVGAGSSASPHTRMWFSNYGSRIDCYAWGENVDTTYTNDPAGNDNTLYTGTFDGTSAASPIVTGAAMIIQGLAKSIGNQIDPSFEFKLSPLQMRRILTTDGTASSNPTTDKIGVMPDLKRIVDGRLINLVPDLYIRDQIGDIGNTTTRVVSASPDIIVRQQAVGDADVAFGANSGTVNNAALSQEVLSGRDHSIYIRALNRGGSPATSATATVYWSPPATLVTPNLWNRIGAAALPAVPVGRVLAVSPRLAWAASRVPSTGHYCFVAIAGATDDPSPNLPNNFPDWARFVQNNNNVAWRNFNVIPAPPSTGPRGYHVFPFNIPGAFDAPRRFAIKALGSLPRTSGVLLKLPLTLARALDITLQEKQIRGYNAIIPLLPFAQQDIGEGILPVGSLAKCELHIRVPLDTYKLNGQFDFAIAQEWEGLEVGRLTYRFGPEAVVSDGKGGCGGHGKCDCGCHHGCY